MALTADRDPLARWIRAGIAAGNAERLATPEIRAFALELRDVARVDGNGQSKLAELLALLEKYPSAEELQLIIAQSLHEIGDARAIEAWRGIGQRHPESMVAFRNLVALTCRHAGPGAARQVIADRFAKSPAAFDQLLAYAEACEVIGAAFEADAAFGRMTRLFRRRGTVWRSTASWLKTQRRYRLAAKLLVGLDHNVAFAPPHDKELHHVERVLANLAEDGHRFPIETRTRTPEATPRTAVSVKLISAMFDRIIAERERKGVSSGADRTAVVMITGSLGCGGAERQLVNTAVGLRHAGTIGGAPRAAGLGPISVVARSLRSREDGSHFLPDLRRNDISVSVYQEFAAFGGNLRTSAVRPYLSALRYLPWPLAEGIINLTDALRALNPRVVHIWQDGMVYAAGIAALLAGTPRIILSPRSVPPPDRPRRHRIEYDIIYKSLLRAGGVSLLPNSRHSAARYAAWLDLAPDSVEVIPNGVASCPAEPDPKSFAMFRAFDRRTKGGAFTLGCVMRIDDNKRPLLWIEVAALVLVSMPGARFIIVGDGPLRAKMAARAQELAIGERVLFVGRSMCVGYWLSKMDAFMLLSEQEGLPNVLIEAQLAAVPVITSPAGGAVETLIPGVTGVVTAKSPNAQEVAAEILDLAAERSRLHRMGVAGERWAKDAFSVSRMLTRTVEMYHPERMPESGDTTSARMFADDGSGTLARARWPR